ncbi:hypothetical protein Mnod_3164 [Methylobacterium nodulans ORS 2060]|uniref:Uncharacterized protein n=1 Tax=Methylobacterium nodulans (strain LMG 21967 / CNCM I-2342 / ORS 2060) TaxID=460265 RepID=B8IJP6_METNO|nr:hypothetical protein Mnod_3164 [Methylobacterium nodulans ORS 2060]
MNRQLSALLQEALMCSVFFDPLDPGLSSSLALFGYALVQKCGRETA